MNLDHLIEEAENKKPAPDQLGRITALAADYQVKKAEMKQAEADLKQAEADFNKISKELIPEAMSAAGVTDLTLSNGRKVSCTQGLSVTVQDFESLTKFLEERGDDGIVKVSLTLGKTPQNVLNKIMQELADKYGILAEVKPSIHHSTLKAYFSRLCGIKKDTVAEVSLAEIDDDMVSTYTYYDTKIK